MEELILVDENDNELGFEEKVRCHEGEGKLHRAFSIFIFNPRGEMLIQKRSDKKPLWHGFWANSCCSHPRRGEYLQQAVHRRLLEEVGFDCELKELFKFNYRVNFEDKGSENECDHVFLGEYEGEVKPNPEEIAEYKWISLKELKKDLDRNPEKYAPWFKMAVERVIKYITQTLS